MKIVLDIGPVRDGMTPFGQEGHVGLPDELAKIYPLGCSIYAPPDKPVDWYWAKRVAEDDPVVQRLFDTVRARGLELYNEHRDHALKGIVYDEQKHCKVRRYRVYDGQDLEQAEYLEARRSTPPFRVFLALHRNDRLWMLHAYKKDEPYRDFKIASGSDSGALAVVVADEARHLLDAQQLQGLQWRTVYAGKNNPARDPYNRTVPIPWGPRVGPPWWELWSSVTLPPASDKLLRVNAGKWDRLSLLKPGEVHRWPYHMIDPEFDDCPLRFSRRALRAVEPFDIALVYERPNDLIDERSRVVSQRFYQVLRQHGLEHTLMWQPVIIDED